MGKDKVAVRARDLEKTYRLYARPVDRFKDWLLPGRQHHRAVHALKGLTFEVEHGSALGIVGSNGAGKSTLLKVLSGTTLASRGEFSVTGKVASLLELGTGFYPGFTGHQNIYLNGMVMGFSRKEIESKVDEIIEFSELGDFIHQPIRTYSSGMIMRLGFSVATAIDPDVLIIDEILAVGDLHFQKRCIDRIMSFRKAGKTILFCSHSLYHVEEICDHTIWIQDGGLRMYDESRRVIHAYENFERGRRWNHGTLGVAEGFEPTLSPAEKRRAGRARSSHRRG
jgi:ABC-type polysaccharide/polyol phosphate transport system ATPase subunit